MDRYRCRKWIKPLSLQDTTVPIVIGVSGHRDLVEAQEQQISNKVHAFFNDLRDEFPDIPLMLLTSLADGADRLAVRIAIERNIPITILLPMERTLYEDDFDPASLAVFNQLLGHAIDVLEMPALSSRAQISQPGPDRDRQYEYMGVYLAAHCHVLLALWDGRTSNAPGGTAHVVEYHHRDTTTLIEETVRRSPIDHTEDESDLVFHIKCARQSNRNSDTNPEAVVASWLTRDDENPRTDTLPARYHDLFERQSAFNKDLHAISEIDVSGRLTDKEIPPTSPLQDLQQLFLQVDHLAIKFQNATHKALRSVHVFAACAGLSFIVYADLDSQPWTIFLYIFFIWISLAIYAMDRRFNWQRKFLDYRAMAEALRIQFYWALAGVQPERVSQFPHDSFMRRQELELGWIRNILRYAARRTDLLGTAEMDIPTTIDSWIQEQLEYYKASATKRTKRARLTSFLTAGCFVGAVVIAVILAFGQASLPNVLTNVFIAAMGTLPLIAAIRSGYSHRVSERELIAQYHYYHRLFANAKRSLDATTSEFEKQEVLKAVGEAAFDENGMWILRNRERPISGSQLNQS